MNRLIKKAIGIAAASVIALTPCSLLCSAQSTDNKLRFGDDGKFTVLQITDTQDDQYPAREMLKLVKLSIEQTQPDLVIITGDIVEDKRIGDIAIDDESGREGVCVYKNGDIDHDATLANVKTATDAVLSIINSADIPFAVTQGNNDYKCSVTNEEWLQIYSSYENCLVTDESADEEGRIDYDLGIYASDSDRQLFNLYMMDTRGSEVTAQQTDWYKAESAALTQANGGTPVPAFVFQHIPIAETGNLFTECSLFDKGAAISGTKAYRLADGVTGYFQNVQTPGKTSEQFASWKECGDVIGAYFGHTHNDGFTGTYDGIELGITYGSEFAKTGPYGIRVFTLDESNVTDYENDLYIYDNGTLEKQANDGYTEYGNIITVILSAIKVFFTNIINLFK